MQTLTCKTDMLPPNVVDDLFFQFCVQNRELRIERNQYNEIIIMAPTNSETGYYNGEIFLEVGIWNRKSKLGYTFDSSTGFKLPNGAIRSPDVSWIAKDRWEAVPKADRKVFATICPDFVIEIRSKTDVLKTLKNKMEEYIQNGAQLAWLLDRKNSKSYVYQPKPKKITSQEIEIIESVYDFTEKLSGGDVLPNFELDVSAF